MVHSARAKRMDRRHTKAPAGRLNLISLMDIFTILVFFLLVNSTEVEVLPNGKSLSMPESVAERKPNETPTVMVTNEQILFQGRAVISVADALAAEGGNIPALRNALSLHAGATLAADPEELREITIMGDKAIPFRLLRKVMATCTAADFGRISLAVMQKGVEQAG